MYKKGYWLPEITKKLNQSRSQLRKMIKVIIDGYKILHFMSLLTAVSKILTTSDKNMKFRSSHCQCKLKNQLMIFIIGFNMRLIQVLFRLSYLKWRQRGSVIRVGDLNAEDPGSNPPFRLRNEFVLGDPRGKFTMLCKQPTGLPLASWDSQLGERRNFNMALKKPFRGVVIRHLYLFLENIFIYIYLYLFLEKISNVQFK